MEHILKIPQQRRSLRVGDPQVKFMLWGMVVDLNQRVWMPQLNNDRTQDAVLAFRGSVLTDGVSLVIIKCTHWTRAGGERATYQAPAMETAYISELSINSHWGIADRCVLIDPGRRDLMYCTAERGLHADTLASFVHHYRAQFNLPNDFGQHMVNDFAAAQSRAPRHPQLVGQSLQFRYTANRLRVHTKSRHYTLMMNKLKPVAVQVAEHHLSQTNSKSQDVATFTTYLKQLNRSRYNLDSLRIQYPLNKWLQKSTSVPNSSGVTAIEWAN
ncbi:hypothetical protein DM01DRAFT_1334753 [Hesseltinella vesiculosa]|uniref:Uncharacterized protein n=1 Tax=Hesseltinella vesiculosa TaxID=101127 RepID=A0A1X2GM72_9FUNG|nr:hypothetical protein DM01DRAFT_1334753 [Hesseltinella vesiculosa]